MYDICQFCIYASAAVDITGHLYYQCDLNDNPDNYSNAECCKESE